MNKKLLLTTFLGFFVLSPLLGFQPTLTQASAQETNSIWKRFSSAEGRFQVLMPGAPKQFERTIQSASGAVVKMQYFLVDRPQESAAYLVSYSDYPMAANQPLSRINAAFNSGRNMMLNSTKSRLLSEKIITLNGHPGREIKYINRSGMVGQARMFFVQSRLYGVIVHTRREKDLPKSIEGFFSSFKLLPDNL